MVQFQETGCAPAAVTKNDSRFILLSPAFVLSQATIHCAVMVRESSQTGTGDVHAGRDFQLIVREARRGIRKGMSGMVSVVRSRRILDKRFEKSLVVTS